MQRDWRITILLTGALFISVAAAFQSAEGATRRAVVIGVDKYAQAHLSNAQNSASKVERSDWFDLDGAVNDALAVRDVLSLHGFERDNVRMLLDGDAKREAILATLRSELVEKSRPGDIAFFYFAGHGSQVQNSSEVDGLDETLVPADANAGAWDVRDKELRHIFGDVIDRGAHLIVVIDACHSGGIARGLPGGKVRALANDPRDVAEQQTKIAADHRQPPGERGALILSAAQSHQYALEARDESGMAHGLFTMSLLRALRGARPDESAESVLQRTQAYVLSEGKSQLPSADASPERLQSAFFGGESSAPKRTIRAAVTGVLPDGKYELAAGIALQLGPGSILGKVGAPDVKLEILSNDGVSKSAAQPLDGGDAPINKGDLFELERWMAPRGSQLAIWMPEAVSTAKLDALATQVARARNFSCARMVDDPTEGHRDLNIVTWSDGKWVLLADAGSEVSLGGKLKEKSLCSVVKDRGADTLFVSLPPPRDLLEKLAFVDDPSSAIDIVTDYRAAHYVLAGRNASSREYAFILPAATRAAETETSLPNRTDWVTEDEAQILDGYATRLARLRAWLTLEPPVHAAEGFPYDLLLRSESRSVDAPGDSLVDGEVYELRLRRSEDVKKDSAPRRHYVYVFAMDSAGKRTLLFPGRQQGTGENFLPAGPAIRWLEEISLGVRFRISPPFGRDTFFMLVTRDPLPNPAVLQAQGVVRGAGQGSPLGMLLQSINTTRGFSVATPVNWSISRLPLESIPAYAGE